jgi:mannose-6-phosphate isomerase-like protein (cupin superfamily)
MSVTGLPGASVADAERARRLLRHKRAALLTLPPRRHPLVARAVGSYQFGLEDDPDAYCQFGVDLIIGGLRSGAGDPPGGEFHLAYACNHVCMPHFETRNIEAVLSGVTEHWSPRTIAVVNDYDVRVVKVQGEFTRHSHPETDEFFLVLSGNLAIRMEDGEVTLHPGDTFVVPRGRAHQPCAEVETTVLLFEPSETINTGDTPSSLTTPRTIA